MTETRRPGRPRTDRVPVLVRFDRDDLADIDWARGEVSRRDWIARVCRAVIEREGSVRSDFDAERRAEPLTLGPTSTVERLGRKGAP